MEFIEAQKAEFPDLAGYYEELGGLFERKLWHQLSVALERFVTTPGTNRGTNFRSIYTDFISKFDSRLSQVRLALIISTLGHSFADPAEALALFQHVLKSQGKLGPEATMCLEMDVVLVSLKLGETERAKELLEGAKAALASLSSSETIVFSKFYKATAEYRKHAGPPQEFYKAALMFLAYTPVEELPMEEKYILATDMALASVTGENIFNFGEVIATPILGALKGSPNQWMHELVLAMNRGSIDEFNAIINANRDQYFAQPSLASRHESIKKKIVLLALMNIAFERPSHDRQIHFSDIAARTRIPIDQVEWVLMRAFSLGLIKGTIDQIDQSVSITWVQPRVLDKDQLAILGSQLETWADRVKDTLLQVEDQTPELIHS